jgi:ArsR family transcriptional regulator, virulence genes transcriptional regulator
MDTTLFDLAEKQASRCKVIGNSRRLLILWQLSIDELSVNEIANHVGSTLQNVSQHLNLLKKTGIVVSRRDGQTIYYRLADHECVRDCLAIHSQAVDKLLKLGAGNHKER